MTKIMTPSIRAKLMRKRMLPLLLAPALLVAALSSQASANEKPTYEGKHFIKISTHGAPVWNATAYLRSYDPKTKTIKTWYRWHESHSGNYALWRFHANPGDWIDLEINSPLAWGKTMDKQIQLLDRNHCFLVKAGGDISYNGDSVQDNCTAK